MPFKIITLFSLFCILLMACSSSKPIAPSQVVKREANESKVDFILNVNSDLTSVLEQAERDQKIVFLDFYADWCLPCQIMDEEVFSVHNVYSFFNENFISYKVNVEKTNGANLKMLFQVEELPTFLFLDAKGKELKRYTGSTSQSNILNIAQSVLQLQP